MPSPGYVSPNTPKGMGNYVNRIQRDLKKHGKLTTRSKREQRSRIWLQYLNGKGQRS